MSQNGAQLSNVYGEPVGIVENTTGEFSAIHFDGARSGLRSGDPVYSGDLLETGADATARIKFVNGKTFNLGCDALMLLNDSSTEPPYPGRGPLTGAVCRLVDIVAAMVLVIAILPLLAITVLLIKLTTRGPVFTRDVQTMSDGRTYSMLRFRCPSCRSAGDSEMASVPHRRTAVGSFIRATRLDELPRVFDVFRGDVSFIGPAPIRFFHG